MFGLLRAGPGHRVTGGPAKQRDGCSFEMRAWSCPTTSFDGGPGDVALGFAVDVEPGRRSTSSYRLSPTSCPGAFRVRRRPPRVRAAAPVLRDSHLAEPGCLRAGVADADFGPCSSRTPEPPKPHESCPRRRRSVWRSGPGIGCPRAPDAAQTASVGRASPSARRCSDYPKGLPSSRAASWR